MIKWMNRKEYGLLNKSCVDNDHELCEMLVRVLSLRFSSQCLLSLSFVTIMCESGL